MKKVFLLGLILISFVSFGQFSFTFGGGLARTSSFTHPLESKLTVSPTVNAGVFFGWNMSRLEYVGNFNDQNIVSISPFLWRIHVGSCRWSTKFYYSFGLESNLNQTLPNISLNDSYESDKNFDIRGVGVNLTILHYNKYKGFGYGASIGNKSGLQIKFMCTIF